MSVSRPLTDKPRLRRGVDLTKAGLSVEEGVLASRIDGSTAIRDLAHVVDRTVDETAKILDRLTRAGVVIWADVDADVPKPETVDLEKPDYGGFIFSPALMSEEGDLDADERKRIIWFHAHLDRWNHYELLQAPRRAEKAGIKRAYFQRSKQWHPDTFGHIKQLGSFKAMLDHIFERIRAAYGVLSDPEQRKKYDDNVIVMLADEDIAEILEQQRKEEREARRAKEAVARRKKNNPMRIRMKRAKALMVEAERQRDGGDVRRALGLAQIAEAYDNRGEHQERVDTLKKETAEDRIAPLLRRGAHFESLTHWSDAIDLFEEAVRIAPEHGPSRIRLAFNMVMGRRDPSEASSHAQRGVHLLPDDPEAHFVLGLCYDRAGKGRAAVRSLTKAVELKPNYKEAKKRLRELRWGF